MAVEPITKERSRCLPRLAPFDAGCAGVVASWVRDADEARRLAPATLPPITAQRVIAWGGPDRRPLLLWQDRATLPLGYGELNVLNRRRAEYWLGHLIVDPTQRGRGFGTMLTRLLLRRAFDLCRAKRVTLVVAPDNEPAIASYRSAGMRPDAYETHHFPTHDGPVRLLRMVAGGAI